MAPMAYSKKTLYDILGVSRDASTIDIGLAYERRKGALEREASKDPNEVTLLHEAFEVLKNERRRAAYDASLVTAEARSAAAESKEAPDLELEPEAAPPRKLPYMPIAIGVVVAIAIAVAVSRPSKPKPSAEISPVVQETAPQPAPPPAPVRRSATEVIADASTSGGQLLSYSMSGQSIPIGLAMSTEPGTMVTTCHGIPAGAKLVVRVQKQSYPVELLVTDEVLDLCKLQLTGFGTPPLKVSTVEPKAGDRVFAVGATAAGEFAATEGTVKQILNTTEGKLVELSMPVGQFSSGGGVFDEFGRLVAISTFQHRSGLSIAYPAAWLGEMRTRQVPPK